MNFKITGALLVSSASCIPPGITGLTYLPKKIQVIRYSAIDTNGKVAELQIRCPIITQDRKFAIPITTSCNLHNHQGMASLRS